MCWHQRVCYTKRGVCGRQAGGKRGEMDTALTESEASGQSRFTACVCEKYRGYWAQQPSNDNSDKCDGSVVTWIKARQRKETCSQ